MSISLRKNFKIIWLDQPGIDSHSQPTVSGETDLGEYALWAREQCLQRRMG